MTATNLPDISAVFTPSTFNSASTETTSPSILAGHACRCHVLVREVGFRNLTVYSDVTVPGGALNPREFIRK